MRVTLKTISKSFIIGVACAAGLSACGIKGDLKTPPPIFGSDRMAEPLKPAPRGIAQTPASSGTQN